MFAQAGASSDGLFLTPLTLSFFPKQPVTEHSSDRSASHNPTPELRTGFPLYWNVHFKIRSREKSGISVAVTRVTDHWGYISCLSLLEFDSERIGALPLSSKVKLVQKALTSRVLLHVLMLCFSKWFVHLETGCAFAAYVKSRLKHEGFNRRGSSSKDGFS